MSAFDPKRTFAALAIRTDLVTTIIRLIAMFGVCLSSSALGSESRDACPDDLRNRVPDGISQQLSKDLGVETFEQARLTARKSILVLVLVDANSDSLGCQDRLAPASVARIVSVWLGTKRGWREIERNVFTDGKRRKYHQLHRSTRPP